MNWDDPANAAANALLTALWQQGDSAAVVADKMAAAGYNVTRNACIGRIHRLTLKRDHAEPINKHRRPKKMSEPRRTPSRAPITMEQLEMLTGMEGVEYLKNSDGCKAILDKRGGEWDLPMVCGKRRGLDFNGSTSPYCTLHFRVYHNPPPHRG